MRLLAIDYFLREISQSITEVTGRQICCTTLWMILLFNLNQIQIMRNKAKPKIDRIWAIVEAEQNLIIRMGIQKMFYLILINQP